MIEVGARAPGFTLPNQDGAKVSLSDFRGRRVVLVFYPMDFSPGCKDQLSGYQQVVPELEAKGAVLVGVNVDHAFAHKAFQEKLGISIPLLADFHPKGEVTKAYGAYIEERGHPNRSLVMIDPEGIVEWVHEAASTLEIPPASLITNALDAAA